VSWGWKRNSQYGDGQNHSKPVAQLLSEKSQSRRGDKPAEPYEKQGQKPWRNNPPRRRDKNYAYECGGRE